MPVALRPVQTELKTNVLSSWNAGHKNVLAVAPCGFGKTVLMANLIAQQQGAGVAIAHRHELLTQISLSLAANEVAHRIIGSPELARACSALHMFELGADYINPHSRVAAASIDTLAKMDASCVPGLAWWVGDEAHHFLAENKWGRPVQWWTDALGLGLTATPCRADGRALKNNMGGVFDTMVEAPDLRTVIDMGLLTDYRVIVPKSNLDLSQVTTTASGEYSPKLLKAATDVSSINGDVVKSYLEYTPGMLGVTFANDIEAANKIAAAFRKQNVKAEVVTAKTPPLIRARILRSFKNREIMQLVNVDLFGEGFNLPAIQVVSMARATQSFSLYAQQFGRVLRLMISAALMGQWDLFDALLRKYYISISEKPKGVVIDHVGNVIRHGLPDRRREWTLLGGTGVRTGENAIPMCVCVECSSPYERFHSACPWCGHAKVFADRTGPIMVDGDMYELSAETLATMRGDIAKIDSSFVAIPDGIPAYAAQGIRNRHFETQASQAQLRDTLQLWAGWKKHKGHNDSEIYRLFFLAYGIDMMSAQTLHTSAATELREKLQSAMIAANVVDSRINRVS